MRAQLTRDYGTGLVRFRVSHCFVFSSQQMPSRWRFASARLGWRCACRLTAPVPLAGCWAARWRSERTRVPLWARSASEPTRPPSGQPNMLHSSRAAGAWTRFAWQPCLLGPRAVRQPSRLGDPMGPGIRASERGTAPGGQRPLVSWVLIGGVRKGGQGFATPPDLNGGVTFPGHTGPRRVPWHRTCSVSPRGSPNLRAGGALASASLSIEHGSTCHP